MTTYNAELAEPAENLFSALIVVGYRETGSANSAISALIVVSLS